MVQNRYKSKISFWMFVLPALVLYSVFAIYPLVRGLWLSTTNWDGTAPWVPAQLEIGYFEEHILGKLAKDRDRGLVLKYYLKDEEQGTYRKLEVFGRDRDRLMSIFKSTGYVNPDMKSVGLQNYKDIFAGKVDDRFFPQRYRAGRFNLGSPLEDAASIPVAEFEKYLLQHLDAGNRAYILDLYRREGDAYRLPSRLLSPNELDQQILLTSIPVLEDDWEDLYNGAVRLGEEGSTGAAATWIESSLSSYDSGRSPADGPALSPEDHRAAATVLATAAEYGRIKSLLVDS